MIFRFIKTEYDQNPDDYAASIDEFSSIRDLCVVTPPQIHETGVRAIQRCELIDVIKYSIIFYAEFHLQFLIY